MDTNFKTLQGVTVLAIDNYAVVSGTCTVRITDASYYQDNINFADLPEYGMFTSSKPIKTMCQLEQSIKQWEQDNE
jgi:hypothetical protein